MVVLTILRLIEDVAIMQTVQPPGRRKELHSAILVVLPDYFGLLSTILTNATNNPHDQVSRVIRHMCNIQCPERNVLNYSLRRSCATQQLKSS